MEMRRPRNSGLDRAFQMGAETPREIWVTEFDEESAQIFREQVLSHSEEDPNKPIVIYIDSYGGSVDSLAKMIETMDECPNQFVTVTLGKAMSAGAILLSHGDIRFCGRNSRVMIHEVLSSTGGNVHDMHADSQEVMRLNKHFIGLMATNCKISGGYDGIRAMFKEKDERDLYLGADEALKFGIVDYIGIPKIVPSMAYDIVLLPPKSRKPAESKTVDELMLELTAGANTKKRSGKTKPKRLNTKKNKKPSKKSNK